MGPNRVSFRRDSYEAWRRRSWLSWRVSLFFLFVPLVWLILTIVYHVWFRDDRLEIQAVDRVTREPIVGATIEVGQFTLQTDRDGRVKAAAEAGALIRIVAPDHDAVVIPVSKQQRLRVVLRPNFVEGRVVQNGDGAPIAAATVEALQDGVVVASTVTREDGSYLLKGVPEGAQLRVRHEDYAGTDLSLGSDQTRADFVLRPDVLRGRVHGPEKATVASQAAWAETATDGTFRLKGVQPGEQIVIKAPGYRAKVMNVPETMELDVSLEPLIVRALYVNALVASREDALEKRLQLVDRTELNAVVIDLKDSTGQVYYDTQVQLAHEIGAVQPILRPRELVQQLKERGLYTIARIVVFEDPVLAEARPEWAIRDRTTGRAWRTWNGLAWVNAYRSEVWQYNRALAVEAASFGFDEIQLDYIRFPSDGPLKNADYGVPHTPERRIQAIRAFLQLVHEALLPTPAYLGVDIFGLTTWELSDSGIGQNLEAIAPVVDYICPMLYPSHFWAGSLGFEIPNDHPYEVVLWSLQNGVARVPEHRMKFRPWLQDFSYGRGKPYGPEEVRAQIQATYEAGLDSWMLWNADSVYQERALLPDSGRAW